MKNVLRLNWKENFEIAEMDCMYIVRVSFPNTDILPIFLASSEQLKKEDISEYLRSNRYIVDDYTITYWIPKIPEDN